MIWVGEGYEYAAGAALTAAYLRPSRVNGLRQAGRHTASSGLSVKQVLNDTAVRASTQLHACWHNHFGTRAMMVIPVDRPQEGQHHGVRRLAGEGQRAAVRIMGQRAPMLVDALGTLPINAQRPIPACATACPSRAPVIRLLEWPNCINHTDWSQFEAYTDFQA